MIVSTKKELRVAFWWCRHKHASQPRLGLLLLVCYFSFGMSRLERDRKSQVNQWLLQARYKCYSQYGGSEYF